MKSKIVREIEYDEDGRCNVHCFSCNARWAKFDDDDLPLRGPECIAAERRYEVLEQANGEMGSKLLSQEKLLAAVSEAETALREAGAQLGKLLCEGREAKGEKQVDSVGCGDSATRDNDSTTLPAKQADPQAQQPEERRCLTCKHERLRIWEEPCIVCQHMSRWEPKQPAEQKYKTTSEVERLREENSLLRDASREKTVEITKLEQEADRLRNALSEQRIGRSCDGCAYREMVDGEDPCKKCYRAALDLWEPLPTCPPKAQPAEPERCENCRYWFRAMQVNSSASCRRNPPVVYDHTDNGQGWPQMSASQWCGEWKVRDE